MTAITESWASTPGTAKSMRSNRGRDTSLELRVRRELHQRGLRYRVDIAPLKGLRSRADVVFTRRRIAVYLDGCFWHGCPVHGVIPTAHSDYWQPKLARNMERDRQATHALQDAGWTVLRFWEHEDTASVVEAIRAEVRGPAASTVSAGSL
jgi:DNA mismatch endonuclease (patch repair protein)